MPRNVAVILSSDKILLGSRAAILPVAETLLAALRDTFLDTTC